MSIQSLIRERLALGSFIGNNVLTVGDGGQFSTMMAAIDWLNGQTVYDTVSLASNTIVAPSQGDYELTGVGTSWNSELQLGDLIQIAGDTVATFEPDAPFYPLESGPRDDTTVRLLEPVVGASAGTTITVVRPRKFTIILLPGVHDVSAAGMALPNRGSYSIVGFGRYVSRLYHDGSGSGRAIETPRDGYLELSNIGAVMASGGANSVFGPGNINWSNPALQSAQAVININGCAFQPAGREEFIGALVRISDCEFNNARTNAQGSLMVKANHYDIQNVRSLTHGCQDAFITGWGGTPARRFRDGNGRVNDCTLISRNHPGSGGNLEVEVHGGLDASRTRYAEVNNCRVLSWDQDGATSHNVSIQTDSTNNNVKIFLNSCVLNSTGAGTNVNKGAAPTDVMMRNCVDLSGAAVT